jgi:hypothetical protein
MRGLARWHAEIERRIASLGAQAEEAPTATRHVLRRIAGVSETFFRTSRAVKKFDMRPSCSRAPFFTPELALDASLGSISWHMRAWRFKSMLPSMTGYAYGTVFS